MQPALLLSIDQSTTNAAIVFAFGLQTKYRITEESPAYYEYSYERVINYVVHYLSMAARTRR